MFFSSSSPEVDELRANASRYLAETHYDQAASCYEQLIELGIATPAEYWSLGLTYLLSSREEEAQLTWSLGLAEADPEQIDNWTLELGEILETAAIQQESQGNLDSAWLIRRYLSELVPNEGNAALQLLRLSILLGRLEPNDLQTWGLIDQLPDLDSRTINFDLLWFGIRGVLDQALEHPLTPRFIAACLPHLQAYQTIQPAIDLLLAKANDLARFLIDPVLACQYGELALTLDPNHPPTLKWLANVYQSVGRASNFSRGLELAKRYLACCTKRTDQLIGTLLVLRGLMNSGANWEEAESALEQHTMLLKTWLTEDGSTDSPQMPESAILGPVLFFYPYFKDAPQTTRQLQNQVAAKYQAELHAYTKIRFPDYKPYPQASVVCRDRQKLRIGYIGHSLRHHSVGWLCRWVLQHFDRDRFEVYTFFNQFAKLEAFSEQWFLQPVTAAYRCTGNFWETAQAIRDSEIDILVDLDSLTFDHTCNVMALKPAPIQATWLGLDACGLPAIDYFIADPYVLPEQAQEYYQERIWRLPQTYIAVDGFEVGVPTLRRDQLNIPSDAVIFLSSQFAPKRHPDTIRLQLQILQQVPNSYFLIKGLGDQQAIQTLFARYAMEMGVEVDRLRFLPRDYTEETHRANLAIADVVLDTFPYNGATTTLETLWMGIPLVTKVGQQFAARNSYGMMMNAGIEEGIAWSDEEYVNWGVRLGTDANLRQQVAWKLRQARQTSPLWNGRQFTQELEYAYEQMWVNYLNQGKKQQ